MDRPAAGLRQRLFAWSLAHLNTKYERFAASFKKQLFADLSGTVLEIGPGTGANLRYLQPGKVHWIGIEPNFFMERYIREEAGRLGFPIEILTGTAEDIPLPDASVDAVISTLVLCAVCDQKRVLQELLRVLKPGGKFVFLEHVAAPRKSWLRFVQNLVTPIWKRLGDGCYPNRETWANLERAGFGSLEFENITAPVPLVSPQIVGVAVKAR